MTIMQINPLITQSALPHPDAVQECLLAGRQTKYTCICCQSKFESADEQRGHFKTDWHSYNLKRKVCKLNPISLDAFEQINTDNQAKESKEILSKSGSRSSISTDLQSNRDDYKQGTSSSHDIIKEEGDWDDVYEYEDGELDDDEELDDEELEEILKNVVQKDTCLFCELKSKDSKKNLQHMTLWHGFFIPEEQYLIDLDGILEYLGFKIGVGATCLWCDKQFTSVHSVRKHMLQKDHCKILYNQETSKGFKEFYDYADQEHIPMKPPSQLVISRKTRPRNHADAAERRALVLFSKDSKSLKHQLVKRGGLELSCGKSSYKSLKKFNSVRAKKILHIGMQNNYAMRGRLRNQNPI